MLERAASYDDLVRRFRWRVPDRFNIGVDVADRQDGDATALIHMTADGDRRWRFRDLVRASNRLANGLRGLGIARGDRIGILLPQRPETAIAHVAAYKLGAIAMPLFTLFGEDALRYRLADSGAAAVVTDAANLPKLAAMREALPDLRHVVVVADEPGPAPTGTRDWDALLEAASDAFTPVDTAADDPALLIYTSGTTGQPKGALHAHRTLLGHLPGVETPHEFFPQPGDLFWTPADWAWIGGLMDVLMPSLHHGVPVLCGGRGRFDPEQAFETMARHGVRNAFLPPTALKMMRTVPEPERFGHRLRSIFSGGETLGAELLEWGRSAFGFTINEAYGQTECNLVISNCAGIMPVRPGAMGRPVAGHEVAVLDADGAPVADGEVGEICVRAPDPVMFLRYWNRPEATAAKLRDGWLRMGDLARRDADGYIWFVGRDDDVITSAGYRIGPGEIEDCLVAHPAVAMAAVVGVPDPVRTEAVKAFLVLREGFAPGPDLAAAIQAHVRTRLAAHEYPRLVEFVDELPMTTTGKIRRKDLKEREIARMTGQGDAG